MLKDHHAKNIWNVGSLQFGFKKPDFDKCNVLNSEIIFIFFAESDNLYTYFVDDLEVILQNLYNAGFFILR